MKKTRVTKKFNKETRKCTYILQRRRYIFLWETIKEYKSLIALTKDVDNLLNGRKNGIGTLKK